MAIVKDFFQCRWCLSEIASPVVLPCGESVCRKHEKELKETKGKCLLCDGAHKLTSSRHFPENKSLSRMIKLEMAKLDFGPTHKEAKQQVEALDEKNDELKRAISDPESYVASFTQKYINQVDLAREEMIKIIEDACDNMKEEISKFKSGCEAYLRKESLSELQNNLDAKIKSWKEKLNELVVNEPLWQEIADEAETARERVESKINENAFELPLVLRHLTDLIRKDSWLKLSESLRIPEMKISDKRDENSVLARNVFQIARSPSLEPIKSEEFTIQGFPFCFSVEFKLLLGKMWLGAYLYPRSNHEQKSVKLSWKFNLFGKNYRLITQKKSKHDFKEMIGWGWHFLITIDVIAEILSHPAYDPSEDTVRVEVVIDESSIKLKDKVATNPKIMKNSEFANVL